MLEQVIRFNSVETPAKMGTFPQYDHPKTQARYAEVGQFLGLGGGRCSALRTSLRLSMTLRQELVLRTQSRSTVSMSLTSLQDLTI